MSRDVTLLHPDLIPRVTKLIKLCKTKGIEIIISQTLRTKAEQDALYSQGRTKQGNIVTNVKYPQSMHCWGLAFDIAVIRGGKAIWDVAAYKPAGELGEGLGLSWGGRWKSFPDAPHFELPNYNTSALIRTYDTPENFIKTWPKGDDNMPGFEGPAKVVFDGKELSAGILNDKTYVEIGEMAKLLGLKKSWNNITKTATLMK